MPFQSEKQRRYLWANEPEIARDWADTYGSRIEKNDGGIMRVGLQWGGPGGKSPGTSSSGGTHEGGYGRSDGPPSKGGGQGDMSIRSYKEKKGDYRDRQREKLKSEIRKDEKKRKEEKLNYKELTFREKLKQNQIKRNKVLAMRKLGLMEEPKTSLWGGLYQGLDKVPGWAEGMTEEELNAIARTGPYLGADDPRTAKELESGSELLGRVFKGGPFNTRNLDQGGDQALPNYYAPRDVHPGTGDDTTIDYDFNRDFQDSLTSAATTPDYYAGDNPLASNIAWGKQFGADPRTMGLTSYAANGGRIPRAFGGIMDSSTGRRAYGLGSIFKSIKKAAGKVLKSPIGKAALIGGLGAWGMGAGPFANVAGQGWLKGALAQAGSPNQKAGWLRNMFSGGKGKLASGWNPWKVGIAATSLLPWMLPGPEEDDEGDKGSNYDVLRNKYASELMNIKSGLSAGSLNPDQWSYLPSDYTYTGAEGGRAGYYAGGQSIPSEYTIEDAMMATTQDKMGGITEVMKQADLARQGSVGQMYAADGGRIGFADGMNEKLAELKKAYDTYTKGGGTLSFDKFSAAFAEENFAQGGRIGAEEGGLMDLGGMEKDYRNDGGFVPLGGEEKADDVPARLSKNEFVFTADAVRGAGGGDIDKGAEIMENIMNNLEQGGQISEETQGLSGAQEMFDVSERLSEVV